MNRAAARPDAVISGIWTYPLRPPLSECVVALLSDRNE